MVLITDTKCESNFKPSSFKIIILDPFPGLCCVFSSRESYDYVESYLERTVSQSDDILREDVPIVLVLAQDFQEKGAQKELRSKARDLVTRYNFFCET